MTPSSSIALPIPSLFIVGVHYRWSRGLNPPDIADAAAIYDSVDAPAEFTQPGSSVSINTSVDSISFDRR